MAAQQPSFIVVNDRTERDGAAILQPRLPVLMLADWLAPLGQMQDLDATSLAGHLEGLVFGLHDTGSRLILSRNALRSLETSPVEAVRRIGTQHLSAFHLESIDVEDFHGVIVSPP